jgi:hypothetical protein
MTINLDEWLCEDSRRSVSDVRRQGGVTRLTLVDETGLRVLALAPSFDLALLDATNRIAEERSRGRSDDEECDRLYHESRGAA